MSPHPFGSHAHRWAQLLGAFEQETILRVRHAGRVWEAANRLPPAASAEGGAASATRAFRTASLTKTFSAALTLKLWEQQVLELDDTLDRHLPPDLCGRLHRQGGQSSGHLITIRQLLNHRSGLYDYATDTQFIADVLVNPMRQWSPEDLLEAAWRHGQPLFAPGQGLAYGDTAYVVLGLIIEARTAMPLAHAYRHHLLHPLRLAHTYLEGKEPADTLEVARAHAGAVDVSEFDPSFDAFGGGGLVSTAGDLDRFITALMQGQVFARPQTLQTMLEGTQAPLGSGTRKTRTACGISEFEVCGHRLWGHLGHWNSFMLYHPGADLALCGSFNQATIDPRQVALLECVVRDVLSEG